MHRISKPRAILGFMLLASLLLLTANTDPQCVPVTPEAAVCLTVDDCQGLLTEPCGDPDAAWECVEAHCVWHCEEPCVPSYSPMSPQDLATELPDKDFLLINVHIPYEGEIAGTDMHVAYNTIDVIVAAIVAAKGPDLTTPVVVYCKSNGMALYVAPKLNEKGYCNVRYLDGGMNAWVNAGYTLEP